MTSAILEYEELNLNSVINGISPLGGGVGLVNSAILFLGPH